MPSIVNGLFSGRSGIASHGTAIAVVGDNISNASTTGYKSSRAEFSDLIAGGQTAGKVVGSGSNTSAVSTIFNQGTIEFTGRTLDMAIDGNGLFTVLKGQQRYYTRSGNFKVDEAGYIVDQNGYYVLGFPANGTGALEQININTISQDSVATTEVAISGNVDASASTIALGAIPAVTAPGVSPESTTTYADLNAVAEFSTVVDVFDSLGGAHTVTVFFFHTASNQYTARAYVNSDEVDDPTAGTDAGLPRQIGTINMTFDADGSRNNAPALGAADFSSVIPWNNGSDGTASVDFAFTPFTQFAAASNILSVTQDGKGIGTVGNVTIEGDGTIFALLSNGQAASIGSIGLSNFANPEGLTRIGNNLLQQSPESGAPIIGEPASGSFGTLKAGSLELSTVDIADQFVKLITLQRGFQANSRIITTINQLLNDIIQLA